MCLACSLLMFIVNCSPLGSFVGPMRLLDTKTGQFVEKDPEETRYAILSHTWDKEGEQKYGQLRKIQQRDALQSRAVRNHPAGGHANKVPLICLLPASRTTGDHLPHRPLCSTQHTTLCR